jgi:dolichol-phosphate mannosyltransferase
MPDPWLVLPTYNEAENLEAFVEAARAKLPASARVLIVDDSSPDGTGRIADALAARHEDVDVLHRARKEGLGPAYIAGFRQALAAGAGLILEMDSDFSHDPAYLPRLLEAVQRADVVVGSRYVAGGGVSDWGPLRRAISRGGSAYARLVLGVDVQDLTGGFKCFRREVLEAIDLDSIQARGYAFQVEMTYRAIRAGFKVVEVPIVFRDRRAGSRDRRRGGLAGSTSAPGAQPLKYLKPDRKKGAILSEVLGWTNLDPGRPISVTGKLTDVTDATFKADVLDADGPVLVDFWAPWCGPCRVVHPVLEEIDGERDDLKIVSINVDENQQTAASYEVLSIPTMILFKDGAIAKKIVGAMPKRRLEAELEPALA